MGFGYHGWGMRGFGGYGIGGVIMMILFWVLIIVGIVYLVKYIADNKNTANSNHRQSNEDNAAKIARERYARGEITKEELDEIMNNLRRL